MKKLLWLFSLLLCSSLSEGQSLNNPSRFNKNLFISGMEIDYLNRYGLLSFFDGVYTSDGVSAVTASDLVLTFTQNGGTATNCVIASIKKSDNTSLSGGENVIRVNFTLTGLASGVETVEIKPAYGGAIKNIYHTPISVNSSTSALNLSVDYVQQYKDVLTYAENNSIAVPTFHQRSVDNTFVSAAVSNGAWAEWDQVLMLADNVNPTFALINWKSPGTRNATLSGSPTWNTKVGIKSNGSGYVDTNYAPSTHGVKYLQNDGSVWAYIVENVGTNSISTLGARGTVGGANNGHIRLSPRNASDNASYIINRNSTTVTTVTNTNSIGLYTISRETSTTNRLYKDGTELSNNANGSSILTTNNIYVCALNGNGTAEAWDTSHDVGFYAIGSGMQDIVSGTSTLINTWISNTSSYTPPTGKIYMLGGQSNQDGQGNVSDLPGYLTGPLARCYVWWSSGWEQLQAGVNGNSSNTKFGPIIPFAYAESQKYPTTDLYFVIKATSGTDLYTDWAPTGAQYTSMIQKYNNAVATLSSPTFMAFCWYQGEADSNISAEASAYETNEHTLMTNVFAATGFTKALVVKPTTTYPYNSTVRTAKDNNFSNGYYGTGGIKLDALDYNPTSTLHLSSQGYIDLGEDMSSSL